MKLEVFDIVFFENDRGVFASGECMRGEVRLKLSQPMKMRSLNISFEGKAKSHWEVKHGRSKTDYRANEAYISHCLRLFGADSGQTTEHPQGFHKYPFTLTLAPTLPSSFEGRRGYVRYNCKATIDRPWKFDEHTKRLFTVIKHLDLNLVAAASIPVYTEQEQTVESCCSSGKVTGNLLIGKTGYVPGESIAYTIDVNNQSSTNVEKIELELRQVSTYTGYSDSLFSSGNPKQHVKIEEFMLHTQGCHIKKNVREHVQKQSVIPALPPTGLDGCGIIDIQYTVILKVHIGWSTLTIERGIIIGTIPLHQPMPPMAPMPIALEGTAPPFAMQPPPYSEPPPSYEESVFGRTNVRDETDDAHTTGQDAMWAPSYPYYTLNPANVVAPPTAEPTAPPYETIQRI